ncbi:MAG: phosphodiester glycosidase family protein, partial [Ktedonobacteraceae bacterium]
SDKQPPQLLIGKRQFLRPPVATRQSTQLPQFAPAVGSVATIEQPPAKRQFLGPDVPSKKMMPASVVRLPRSTDFPQISQLALVHVQEPPVLSLDGQPLPFTQAAQAARIVAASPQALLPPVGALPVALPQLPEPVETRIEEKPSRNRWRSGKRTQQKQGRKHKGKKSHRKRLRRLLIVVSLVTIIAVVFFSQGNGVAGAWLADAMRTVLGPTITARVESWYLGFSDTTHNIQYQLGGQHVNAPWSVGTLPPTPVPPPTWSTLKPMPLAHISSVVTPGIAGEGIWYTQEQAPTPYNYLPLDAKAFVRPDPSHPYAIVTMLQFDMRFISLHMVAGTVEPGGAIGHDGTGVIPSADQQSNALLAAFNGGFKYADGQYGMMANGVVYVPPQNGVATIAVTKEGKIMLGGWGTDPRFTSANHDLVAWRQNAALLINNGVLNPLTSDGSAWGGTILNSAYTWRSGLGITASGTLIYAAGDYLTALTLGQAMKAAGVVMAMQTDINPFWVRAFLYSRNSGGAYNIVKLNPAMQGTGTEYLYGNERDFFYLTRYSPPPPPQPAHARETYSQ